MDFLSHSSNWFFCLITDKAGSGPDATYAFEEAWLLAADPPCVEKVASGRTASLGTNPAYSATGGELAVGDYAIARSADGMGGLAWEVIGLGSGGSTITGGTGVTNSIPQFTGPATLGNTPNFTFLGTLNGAPNTTFAVYTTTGYNSSTPNYTFQLNNNGGGGNASFVWTVYPTGTSGTPNYTFRVTPLQTSQNTTFANGGSPIGLNTTFTNPSTGVIQHTVGNTSFSQGVTHLYTVDADGDIDSVTQTVAVDGSSTSFVHSYTLNGSVTQLALTGTLVLTGATVTATTQSAGNNSTLVATTAYVDAAVAAADCCPAWTVTTAQFDKTNTTLANVTGLSATLENSKTYYFEALLNVTADITGGSKYAIGGTATASAVSYTIIETSLISRANTIADRQTSLGGSASQSGATSQVCRIVGTITTSAAGTLTVQFAQDSASGTSSVLVGSTFRVEEIA